MVSLNQKKNEENFWKNFPLSHDRKNFPLFISGLTVAIDCLPAVSSTIDILWLPAAATKAPKVTVFEICPMTTPWYHRIVAVRIVNCHRISLSRLGNSTIVRKQPEKTKVAISLTFCLCVVHFDCCTHCSDKAETLPDFTFVVTFAGHRQLPLLKRIYRHWRPEWSSVVPALVLPFFLCPLPAVLCFDGNWITSLITLDRLTFKTRTHCFYLIHCESEVDTGEPGQRRRHSLTFSSSCVPANLSWTHPSACLNNKTEAPFTLYCASQTFAIF